MVRLLWLALCCTLVGVSGCSMMKDVFALSYGILKEFKAETSCKVEMSTTGRMTVTFGPGRLSSLPAAEQRAEARRITEYVRDHYPGYPKLEKIEIVAESEGSMGPVTITNRMEPQVFACADLGPAPTGGTASVPSVGADAPGALPVDTAGRTASAP